MKMLDIKNLIVRGDIYYAYLRGLPKGHNFRPVIVIQCESLNEVKNQKKVIVIPCTTTNREKIVPEFNYKLRETSCVSDDTTAQCSQPVTIEKNDLKEKIGHINPRDFKEVEIRLKRALSFWSI